MGTCNSGRQLQQGGVIGFVSSSGERSEVGKGDGLAVTQWTKRATRPVRRGAARPASHPALKPKPATSFMRATGCCWSGRPSERGSQRHAPLDHRAARLPAAHAAQGRGLRQLNAQQLAAVLGVQLQQGRFGLERYRVHHQAGALRRSAACSWANSAMSNPPPTKMAWGLGKLASMSGVWPWCTVRRWFYAEASPRCCGCCSRARRVAPSRWTLPPAKHHSTDTEPRARAQVPQVFAGAGCECGQASRRVWAIW